MNKMMNKMKQGFGKLASLKEAKEAIFGLVEEKDIEAINIDDSLNRALAENIIARIDVPDFKKSAMDGFAVRAEDTFNASNTSPKKLKIIDSVTAGVVSKKEIKNNECIAVTTGAPLPMGADSVLMVEFTEQKNNELTTYKSVAPGENTINIGSDIKKGLVIAKKGFVINPRIIGAIASQGIKEIKAKKKPLIAYFSTGNEIIAANEKLEKGKVASSASAMNLEEMIKNAISAGKFAVVAARSKDTPIPELRQMSDRMRSSLQKSVYLLASANEEKIHFLLGVSHDLIKSEVNLNDAMKLVAPVLGVTGGGRSDLVQGGGKNDGQLENRWDEILHALENFFSNKWHRCPAHRGGS